MKAWWRELPTKWKWTIGVLMVPVSIVLSPLLLAGLTLALLSSPVIDAFDSWSE